jgi:hypothetical protein
MQNSGIAEAQFHQSASTGPLVLQVYLYALISVVRWTADQQTKIAVCPTSVYEREDLCERLINSMNSISSRYSALLL